MTPIFHELPRPLGVYTLTRLLELRSNTALYEARQTHVDRAVVLEVLAPGVPHAEEVAFLAQARLRVASDELPHVANVFESLRAEGLWFLTQELPKGQSLAETAAGGHSLSVSHICKVVQAAAEMYEKCRESGHCAMPLASSSIFIEDNGEVHFLSPLVEGKPNKIRQMKSLAAVLWAVCPRGNAIGIGRTVTLIQWLNEGREGQFLTWDEIGAEAASIQALIDEAARNAAGIPISQRLRNWFQDSPRAQKIHSFLTRWGTHTGVAVASVIIISAMGNMFGMGAPRIEAAENNLGIICHVHGNTNVVVHRYPVSVQKYAEFLHAIDEMHEDQIHELMHDFPSKTLNFQPINWEAQWERGDVEAPVTGVSYWCALLYTRVMGGSLPTAPQAQAAISHGATAEGYEWTCSEEENPLPGIYTGKVYLLCDPQGKILPISDRNWVNESCTFRTVIPDNQ